jgi:hypothetical protein
MLPRNDRGGVHMRGISVVAVVGVAGLIAGCGGGKKSSAGSSVSAGAAKACIERAGFKTHDDGHDSDIGELAQLSVTEPDGPVTIAFMKDSDIANEYWKVSGGAVNKGPEPGGNDQVGSTVVAWYKKGAALTKIENCVRG